MKRAYCAMAKVPRKESIAQNATPLFGTDVLASLEQAGFVKHKRRRCSESHNSPEIRDRSMRKP
ncbi:MAG: hypothetical protein WAM72_22985, partial [Xanthobacteraceae bacterium]